MQSHHTALLDPDLARGRMALGLFDLPAVATGQTAAVFRISTDDASWAVRCLTLDGSHLPERYAGLRNQLIADPLPAFVEATWQDTGIRVNGEWWPVVKMHWVEGRTLGSWIEEHLTDRTSLLALNDRFASLMTTIWNAGIAHGDLQHGNLVIRPDGEITLVDYDGCVLFRPNQPDSLLLSPAHESGHPNYQHPHRVETGIATAWVDTFSALVITTSLNALAEKPDLWRRFHNDENLLFTAADFESPGDSALWRELHSLQGANRTAETLENFCRRDSLLEATLTQILDGSITIEAGTYARARIENSPPPTRIRSEWTRPETTGAPKPPAVKVTVTPRKEPYFSGDRAVVAVATLIAVAIIMTLVIIALNSSARSMGPHTDRMIERTTEVAWQGTSPPEIEPSSQSL